MAAAPIALSVPMSTIRKTKTRAVAALAWTACMAIVIWMTVIHAKKFHPVRGRGLIMWISASANARTPSYLMRNSSLLIIMDSLMNTMLIQNYIDE